MLGVTVVGRNTFTVALFVGANISQGVKTILFANGREELDRRIVAAFAVSFGLSLIEDGEFTGAIARFALLEIANMLGFAHLDADVGIVAGASAMPAPVIPRQTLICVAGIRVNDAVNAGLVIRRLVPAIDEDRG
jgi:hypothetical protein